MRREKRITHTTSTAEGMRRIGAALAQLTPEQRIFAFSGPLGAGKTTCIQGFGEALGISKNLISPTYTIIHEHPISAGPIKLLLHVDLYRVVHEKDLLPLGIHDYFQDPETALLIEWADRHPELFQNIPCVRVAISFLTTRKRKIEIACPI